MRRNALGAGILTWLLLGQDPRLSAAAGESGRTTRPKTPAAKEQIELRLPPDLVFERGAGSLGAVVFRHTTHAALTENRCTSCHPQVFRLVHPTRRTSHAEMEKGRSCGACHDGRRAFGIQVPENCSSCHAVGEASPQTETLDPVRRPGSGEAAPLATPRAALKGARLPLRPRASGGDRSASDGRSEEPASPGRAVIPEPSISVEKSRSGGLKDITLPKSADSPGRVTFRHATHGTEPAGCARCHPSLFAMKAGSTRLDKEAMRRGETCGACHNGRKAFGVDDSAHCERCHNTGGSAP